MELNRNLLQYASGDFFYLENQICWDLQMQWI
jgi:hypothetical protein